MLNIALLVLCINCSHPIEKIVSEESSIREIDIMANLSSARKVKLSEVASNIEYCILETDKKCLVSGIDIIYCARDYIVASGGSASSPAYYVFERKTGNFIRQISRYGQGPGEYSEIVSLFWDGNKEQICVFGNNQYLFFNLDGTLSHQTNRFKHWIYRFVAHEDFYIGYVPNRLGNETIRIAFYDKTGVMDTSISNHRTWNRFQTWYSGGNDDWLYAYNNNLYFKELYCDTLYHIKDFMLHPRYVFETNGLSVPYDIQEGGRYDFLASLRNGGIVVDRYEKYVCILKIFEDKNHLYFPIEYRQKLYPAIYLKAEDNLQIMPPVTIFPRRGKEWKMPRYGFENDLDGGLPFWPQQMVYEKEMMCVYTAEELLELDITTITDEKLKNVLKNLKVDDNPIVAIVTLNE